MAKKHPLSDQELDAVFASASASPPDVSIALMQKVMADAEAVADARVLASAKAPRVHVFKAILSAIGGWPAVGGLATATVAGIWLGFSPPAAVDDLTAGYLTGNYYDLADFMPSIDAILEEG